MTKNELVRLLKISMMNSLRNRDKTDPFLSTEQLGYYDGQFHTYEEIIDLLCRVDIYELETDDVRCYSNA